MHFFTPFLTFEGSKVSRVYAVACEMKSIFYQLYKLHFVCIYIKIHCYRFHFKARSQIHQKHLSHLYSVFFLLFIEESLTKCESSSRRLLFLETGVRIDTLLLSDNNLIVIKLIEPRCEKPGLRGFRSGPLQTGLYSHRRWPEA